MSAHFIHKGRVEEPEVRADTFEEVRQETVQYWRRCQQRFGRDISVVAGFDANVSLPGTVENITGATVLKPLKSHTHGMQQRVLA